MKYLGVIIDNKLTFSQHVDIRKLQVLQNRAMHLILKRDRMSSTARMLQDLKWLNVSQKIHYSTLLLVPTFKIKNRLLAEYLLDNVTYVSQMHHHFLRCSNDFRLPNYTTRNAQNNLYYSGLKLFTRLPNELKTIDNLNEFKLRCKRHVINNF